MLHVRNLMKPVASGSPGSADASLELFETLAEGNSFKLERIVSQGQTTPPGEWYDQSQAEWVVLLSGRAILRFAEPDEQIELSAGDYLQIPAGCRHRVEWTDDREACVWLGLHFEDHDR